MIVFTGSFRIELELVVQDFSVLRKKAGMTSKVCTFFHGFAVL